jgi:signal transduction histidine kinase
MDRAVGRMTTMVDNLRNFSRGGGPMLAPVELGEVARMAVELTAGSQRHGVMVDSVDGAIVLGDPTRLEQVVINLVANALQAEGDPVVVKVRYLDADRAFLEVTDHGPGVPSHLRDRIFDAFFTTKPPGQGTGLGLSISARIVQEHGGRIEVDDNPGGGARFRIVLPLHRTREIQTG